ncbi:MAG: RNA polymerase sigma factor [Bacteroidales bacterium]|nr:RNA polymerase sigma factor [Bacteroidales bacterium]
MTRDRFIELVRVEQEPLRRFLLALCGGDRDAAEDIAQDTLVKAYLASSGYAERYKFRTWLFKIAYRTFLDYAKRPRFDSLSELSCLSEKSDLEADVAFRHEALYHAINQLPEQSRAAVLLYHIEGYSIADIAAITHSNPIAVRQRLSRGLKKLKTILER